MGNRMHINTRGAANDILEKTFCNGLLGLTLVILFFDGLGGMALLAGLWGIWHIISGLTLGTYWSRRPPRTNEILRESNPA